MSRLHQEVALAIPEHRVRARPPNVLKQAKELVSRMLRTGAARPPQNSKRFSVTAGSLSAIPSAGWRTCNSAEPTPC
jgi:hypothetical protein